MSKNQIAWGGAGICNEVDNENNLKARESFSDIMSEDLAKNQQKQEDNHVNKIVVDSSYECPLNLTEGDTSNDLFIAQLLQQDLDREYDQQVNREEKHLNKNSKVVISFNNYKACPQWYESDSETEIEEVDDENIVIDSFEARKQSDPVMPACGYAKVEDKFITKHDSGISGRRNAERMMNFPPEVNTGDGGGFDMLLSNRVFNELKSNTKPKKIYKEKGDQATSELALDKLTRLLLLKFTNNGILKEISGPIAVGKESVVLHARGGTYEETDLAVHCAIKVFKTTLSDFKTRERYIKCDDRFKCKLPRNVRKTITLWAEKEYHNLARMHKAGIPCPRPYVVKDHVLLMSFVGTDHIPAPKLKHVNLSFAEWCLVYEQVIEVVNKMYKECNLVHADLSEYNILWHEEKCWFIDVGQSVEPKSKQAFLFLLRDCRQIVTFFQSKELPNLPSHIELFNSITGFDIIVDNEEDISILIEKKVDKFTFKTEQQSNEHFDYLWNETQKEKVNEETKE